MQGPAARGVLFDLRCFAARQGNHGNTGHTVTSLIRWYGGRAKRIQTALKSLTNRNLIAVKTQDGTITIPRWDEAQETPAAARKRRQRAREKERDSHADVMGHVTGEAEVEADSLTALGTEGESPGDNCIPVELCGLELYERDVRLAMRWPELLRSWRRTYPRVDIAAEVAKAHAWEIEHPKKRKKDRAAYLGRWLRRCADRQAVASAEGDAEWVAATNHLIESGVLEDIEREALASEAAREKVVTA